MKKKTLMVYVLSGFAIIVMIISGTLAYLMSEKQIDNVFEVGGEIRVDLEEKGWIEPDDMLPGTTLLKDPKLINIKQPCYVRLKLELLDLEIIDGKKIYTAIDTTNELGKRRAELMKKTMYYDPSVTYSNDTVTTLNIVKNHSYTIESLKNYKRMNDTQFQFDAQSSTGNVLYFNYIGNNGIMNTNETAVLFTNIVVPTDWNTTEYDVLEGEHDGFTIRVTGQAIDADSFQSIELAMKALNDSLTK